MQFEMPDHGGMCLNCNISSGMTRRIVLTKRSVHICAICEEQFSLMRITSFEIRSAWWAIIPLKKSAQICERGK